jgi:hypothetical protein
MGVAGTCLPVRNLPIKVISHGANSSGIPPQEARRSSELMKEWDLKLVASKAGRHHMENTKLSGNARKKIKKY